MNSILGLLFPIVIASTTITPYTAPFTPVSEPVVTIPIETEKAPEIAVSSQPKPVKKKDCSCVMYLRSKGVPMPKLYDARNLDIPMNSPPVKGGIVKLKYNEVYHVAYIERIEADGIYISEQNYSKDPKCPVTYRVLDPKDKAIIGFTRTGYSNEPPEPDVGQE